MGVGDILSGVGRAVGAVAEPVLQRTAEVVSGEAPQLDAEQRQRQEKLEDEQLNAKAAILENNLAMGQKYGTLSPGDQQKYIDAITGLYNKPRHAPLLMEKLRKAIHPNGAYAQAPEAPLPNATPAGGTIQEDATVAAQKEADRLADQLTAIDRRYQDQAEAAKNRKSTAKSPPLTGDKLPLDAMDASGNPISAADRTAGKSFVEWNNAWWPVAKPKPAMKTIKGHLVLVDPQTGATLRDLGPTQGVKVTRRQTLQPGDDGQMHLVTLTSVTTPEGATVDVTPEETEGATQGGGGSAPPSSAPKTPAKKVNPGSILPKTGAKITGSSGPVVPGLTALAKSKTLAGKSQAAQYIKAAEDANSKKLSYQNAAGLLADNSRQTDLELVYAWVRSNVQGAGRMTNTEINQTATAGSWGVRVKNAISHASTGRLAPEMEQQFLSDIKRSYENSQAEADNLKKQLDGGQTSPQPTDDPAVDKFLKSF